jgi:hypothetical protein
MTVPFVKDEPRGCSDDAESDSGARILVITLPIIGAAAIISAVIGVPIRHAGAAARGTVKFTVGTEAAAVGRRCCLGADREQGGGSDGGDYFMAHVILQTSYTQKTKAGRWNL